MPVLMDGGRGKDMKNLIVWARKYAELECFEALNAYLIGNSTFAEAAIASMEALHDELERIKPESMLDRYRNGEDPEVILRDILGLNSGKSQNGKNTPAGDPASPAARI